MSRKRIQTTFEIRNADFEGEGRDFIVRGISDPSEPNKQGMLLDYESSKPYIEKYVADFEARTGGESKGALREMHQPSAVGCIRELEFDDGARAIPVAVLVSDDRAQKKVLDKTYTAFSWFWRIVGKPWEDTEATKAHGRTIMRYTGNPVELSLVDSPNIPGVGTGFTSIENADLEGDDDMDNEDQKVPTEPVAPEPVPAPDAAPVEGGAVKNGVYTAGRIGEVVETLHWLQKAIEAEEKKEGDDESLPEDLKAVVRDLAGVWARYSAAQAMELAGGEDVDMLHVSDDDEFDDLEIENCDAIENGDFPGHPFRGNQYKRGGKAGAHHGASHTARRATVRAHSVGDKASHKAAASYHKAAAAAHKKAGNKKMVAHHTEQAKYHSGVAGRVKNGEDVPNADLPAVDLASIVARLDKLEAATVANADLPTRSIHVPVLTTFTKDDEAGVVKNADAPDPIRAKAEEIASAPPARRAEMLVSAQLQKSGFASH